MVHTSKDTAPNVQAPGFDAIKNSIVKRYDYIYTGKNTEVINFNIDFSVGFSNVMAAASYSKSQGVQDSKANSKQDNKEDNKPIVDTAPGAKPPTQAGASGSQRKYTGTKTSYGGAGGAQTGETAAQAAARVFHDAITNPNDMVVLEMDIWGDPYWIVNSGMGNYTSKQVPGIKDLNKDGSVNWQSSEVDIWVYFRSPVDINPATGLYDFKSPNIESLSQSTTSAPSIAFSGLYCVNRVTTTFRQGQFKQQLKGFRRPLQDPKTTPATNEQLANSKTPASDKAGYATNGKGQGIY
jgi:hypothetical protein